MSDLSQADAPHGISRRRFLRDATIVATGALTTPAVAATKSRRRRSRRPTVAVLGGGVAGLTAAHELASRGFEVTLLERKALGGKARSIPVPRTGTAGRAPLPGEHGFRIEFGFYHNLPDTMRRIPVPGGGPDGVHGNLVDAGDFLFARDGGREAMYTLLTGPMEPLTVDALRRQVIAAAEYGAQMRTPDEPAFLARQLAIYMTSSDERRLGQWEQLSWWDYMQAERMSDEYQRLFVRGVTEIPAALKAREASTRTVGGYIEADILTRAGLGADGAPNRVLNAPTNEAWIDPWIVELRRLGADLRVGQTVEALRLRNGRIVSARTRDHRGKRHLIEADWFVCALPVRQAAALWNAEIRAADPRLEAMRNLQTAWLTGIQFYLRRETPVNHGHVAYIDAPWSIASISQAQFWRRGFARSYGDGQVVECLSATIGNWDCPGIVFNRPARNCTPSEIAREVWAQIKASLEPTGRASLPDEILHSWFLDPAISYPRRGPVQARNDDPYFQNLVGSWEHRPDAATAITNLMLAGDYVRTQIDVATMEGANESARSAVNAILAARGSHADQVPVFTPYAPPELKAVKRLDAERYQQRQPHLLDTPWIGSTTTRAG